MNAALAAPAMPPPKIRAASSRENCGPVQNQLTYSHHIRRDSDLQAARCAKAAAVTSYCNGWLDRGRLEQMFRSNPLWRHA